jgi:hypothetical protein
MVPEVSKRSIAFILKGQRVPEDKGNTFLPIVGTPQHTAH